MKKALLISVLLNVLFIFFLGWKYYSPPKQIEKNSPPKIVYLDNPNGGKIAQTTPSNVASEKIVNIILPALKIAKKELESQTDISSVQNEQLTKSDLDREAMKKELDEAKKETIIWKNKWMTSVVNLADSTNNVTVNAETNVSVVKRKNKRYISVMSPNKAVFFNGLEVYEQELKPNLAFLEISTDFSVLKNNLNLDFSNLNYRAYLQFEFNPDGKWKPYLFFGGQTQFDKFQQQYGVGIKTRILKF